MNNLTLLKNEHKFNKNKLEKPYYVKFHICL